MSQPPPTDFLPKELFLIKTGALDQIKDIIIAVDNQNRLTYLNKAAIKQYGIDKEKSLCLKLTQLYAQLWFSPEDEHEAILSIKEKGYWEGTNIQIQPDGTKKVVETAISSIKDETGEKVGLLSISRDITDRTNVDDWLLESNQRLKYVVEAAGMMIYEIEDNTKKVVIVRGLEELLGYSVGEVPSTVEWWVSQIHPEDRLRAQEQFYPTKPVDKVINEYRIKTKNTKFIFVEGIAKVLRDKTGKPLKIIGSIQNITDRKNLERLLQEKERLAAVGVTAGMVGHDIRNPLQAIMSDIYLLRDELTTNIERKAESVTESLESIEKNIDYINKIVADLQDYARPVNPECAELSLYEFTQSIFEMVTFPENLTPYINIDKTFKLKSDPTLLKRILTNLVSNAIQAMPKGGKLVIGASENKSKILLTVEDTGMGIPEEFKANIFKPLKTTKSKGQGLGLAVVKKFVEALGGNISFESKVGNGTKFTIMLPKT